MEKINKKQPIGKGLLILAVVCFINPNINIVDVLPDFIGAFIIAKYLTYLADRVPYFAEARIAFLKLALVSLLKLPALLIMMSIRSSNVSDNDIIALFVFSFAICEIIFYVSAVGNLFSGIFYLGERSDIPLLIAPFSKGGKKGGSMTPDSLKTLIIFCGAVKLISAVVPELFLLTQGVDSVGGPVMNFYSGYPYAIIICFVCSLTVGIITAKRSISFIRAVDAGMSVYAEADKLITPEIKWELDRRLTVKELSFAMTLIAWASFFVLEIRDGSMKEINLVPCFILPLIMMYAMKRMNAYTKVGVGVYITGALAALTGILRSVIEGAFLDTYGYTALVYYKDAKAAYMPSMIIAAVDAVAMGVFLTFAVLAIVRMIKEHAILRVRRSDGMSGIDKERKNYLVRLTLAFGLGGFLLYVAKTLNVIFKYYATVKAVAVEDMISNITVSKFPWFGTFLFAFEVAFILATMFISSRIKDEIVFSYGDDGKL